MTAIEVVIIPIQGGIVTTANVVKIETDFEIKKGIAIDTGKKLENGIDVVNGIATVTGTGGMNIVRAKVLLIEKPQ